MRGRFGKRRAMQLNSMSREAFQRAVADMVRLPAFCATVAGSERRALDGYSLSEAERARLGVMARRDGMSLNCMLYRASRLVGITRRLPRTLLALGADLRPVFDAYLVACPDANPDFDTEARAFAAFLNSYLSDAASTMTVDAELARAALRQETDMPGS